MLAFTLMIIKKNVFVLHKQKLKVTAFMRQQHIYVKTTYKALTRRPWSLTLGFLACLGLGGLRRQRHNPGRMCHSFFR